ncbi:radical SAM protein [candidate division WWE3 bacterium]|nr:radical SAM protein [candidate division WWE3 bacterium]
MEIKETQAKSILTKSKLPDADYVVNPYTGCRFGCVYCYASFMGRYVGKDTADWGEFVYIKINAPELLEKEITKLKNKGKGISILFSSVTDPYQGVEAKYQLTRKCLKVLVDYEFEGLVSILTKSEMVTRDIDLLKKLKNVEAGLTITSIDDSVSRFFEKYAPNVSQRFVALGQLNKAGIDTYAFVGPLLPNYINKMDSLDSIFRKIKNTGTTDIYVEHINLSKYIYERLKNELPDLDNKELEMFDKSKNKDYRIKLDKIVKELVTKYGLKLRLDDTIYHKDL